MSGRRNLIDLKSWCCCSSVFLTTVTSCVLFVCVTPKFTPCQRWIGGEGGEEGGGGGVTVQNSL